MKITHSFLKCCIANWSSECFVIEVCELSSWWIIASCCCNCCWLLCDGLWCPFCCTTLVIMISFFSIISSSCKLWLLVMTFFSIIVFSLLCECPLCCWWCCWDGDDKLASSFSLDATAFFKFDTADEPFDCVCEIGKM